MAKKTRHTGRPKLLEGKREHIIKAKLTEQELRQLKAMEQQLGLNRSEIIKGRVLHDSHSLVINAAELMKLLDGIGAELGRAGNNINQLARHANTLNKQDMLNPGTVAEFNQLLAAYVTLQQELEKCLRQIIRLMRN
ncbi:MobC family plasmid mobilization relaxosome protein [Mucilaginibacter pineti]|nr:MobC family plasmid mobilization relaxosome protein [Mucilaginibacter pineti]